MVLITRHAMHDNDVAKPVGMNGHAVHDDRGTGTIVVDRHAVHGDDAAGAVGMDCHSGERHGDLCLRMRWHGALLPSSVVAGSSSADCDRMAFHAIVGARVPAFVGVEFAAVL